MKERPILFSAPMVRALLNCTKSQTRRVVKLQKEPTTYPQTNGVQFVQIGGKQYWWNSQPDHPAHVTKACPYGQPGDRLWVRETWQGPLMDLDTMENEYRASPDDFHKPEYCVYAADGGPAPEFITLDDGLVCRWRPSIHMPRWASRINLEITGVRVEKLQDISEADSVSEGCQAIQGCEWRTFEEADAGIPMHKHTAIDAYSALWDAINGPGSWDANPWVWVVEFKRVMP